MAEIGELEVLLDMALGNEKFIRGAFFSAAATAAAATAKATAKKVNREATAAAAAAAAGDGVVSGAATVASSDEDEGDCVLYVKGIPADVDDDELRDVLETCGPVVSLDRPNGANAENRLCYAIARYADAESAAAAEQTLNGVSMGSEGATSTPLQLGKLGFWKSTAGERTTPPLAAPNKDGTVLQARFLEVTIGDAELAATYGAFGELKSAVVARDAYTGLSLGYGIVQFVDAAAAKAAATATHGRPLREYRLEVDLHSRPGKPAAAVAGEASGEGPQSQSSQAAEEVGAQNRLTVRCGKSGEPVKMYSTAVWPCWVCDVETCESTGPDRTKGPLNPMYGGNAAIADDWAACEACYRKLSDPSNLDIVASPIREAMLDETYATVSAMAEWDDEDAAPTWRAAHRGDGSWMQELGPGQLSCMQFSGKLPSTELLQKSIRELIRHQNKMVRSVWALHADPDGTLYKRLAITDYFLKELASTLESFGPLDEGERRSVGGEGGDGHSASASPSEPPPQAASGVQPLVQPKAPEIQTPGAKAKSVLIGFFAKSTLVTLVHFLQTTWERAQTRQTPMTLVAAQACESMLEEGLQMLKGLVPASLSSECEKSPLWLKMLSQASVQLQTMCCKGAVAPEVPQTLAMELSIELAAQTGSARTLINAIIGLVDRSRYQHNPSIARGLDAVCKRMLHLASSAPKPPTASSVHPASVDLDAAASATTASPNRLLAAAETLLAVLSSFQVRKPAGMPFVLDGSVDELGTISKLLGMFVLELGAGSILKTEDASMYETAAIERGLSAVLMLLNKHFKQAAPAPAPSTPPDTQPLGSSTAECGSGTDNVNDAAAIAAADAAETANAVKDQLLAILGNADVSAGVYLTALDAIFVGWKELKGTDSELLTIKRNLVDQVLAGPTEPLGDGGGGNNDGDSSSDGAVSPAPSAAALSPGGSVVPPVASSASVEVTPATVENRLQVAQAVLRTHWKLLMPTMKERISTLTELLQAIPSPPELSVPFSSSSSSSSSSSPPAPASVNSAFLLELLLDTMCTYHNFVSPLKDEIVAVMPLVLQFCDNQCTTSMTSKTGQQEYMQLQAAAAASNDRVKAAKFAVAAALADTRPDVSVEDAVDELSAAIDMSTHDEAALATGRIALITPAPVLVAACRFCTMYQRSLVSQLRYGNNEVGPLAAIAAQHLKNVAKLSANFLSTAYKILSELDVGSRESVATTDSIVWGVSQGSPVSFLADLLPSLLLATLPSSTGAARGATISQKVVLSSVPALLELSMAMKPFTATEKLESWPVAAVNVVNMIDWLHRVTVPLLLSRCAALEAGTPDGIEVPTPAPAPKPKPPKCTKAHDMSVSTHQAGNYSGGWVCDKCKSQHPVGSKRWFCTQCLEDVCFGCHANLQVATKPVGQAATPQPIEQDEQEELLSKYAVILAGGATQTGEVLHAGSADGAGDFWAQFAQEGSELAGIFFDKFLIFGNKVNQLFKRFWQSRFAETLRLLLGANIKHLGLSQEAEEWAKAPEGTEPSHVLSTVMVQMITTHNLMFQHRRHVGEQENFFGDVKARLDFLLHGVHAAKEGALAVDDASSADGGGSAAALIEGGDASSGAGAGAGAAALFRPQRETSAMTWADEIDPEEDRRKISWLQAKLPAREVTEDEKLAKAIVAFTLDHRSGVVEQFSEVLHLHLERSRRRRHGFEAFSSLLRMVEEGKHGLDKRTRATVAAGWCGAPFASRATPSRGRFFNNASLTSRTEQRLFVGVTSDMCTHLVRHLRSQTMELDGLLVSGGATIEQGTLKALNPIAHEMLCHFSALTQTAHPIALEALVTDGIYELTIHARQLDQRLNKILALPADDAEGTLIVRAPHLDVPPLSAVATAAATLELAVTMQVAVHACDLPSQVVSTTCAHLLQTVQEQLAQGSTIGKWHPLEDSLRVLRALVVNKVMKSKLRDRDWVDTILEIVRVGQTLVRVAAVMLLEAIQVEDGVGEAVASDLAGAAEDAATKNAAPTLKQGENEIEREECVKILFRLLRDVDCVSTTNRLVQFIRVLTHQDTSWSQPILAYIASILESAGPKLNDLSFIDEEGARDVIPVLMVIGHTQNKVCVGCKVQLAEEGTGFVVDARSAPVGVESAGGTPGEEQTLRSTRGPESTNNSYYGLFFDVSAKENPISVTGIYAGSQAGNNGFGDLYVCQTETGDRCNSRDEWEKVSSAITLHTGGAQRSNLSQPVEIAAGATRGFYLHCTRHNEAVGYVSREDRHEWEGGDHSHASITPGRYSKSSTPFNNVDDGTRQLAGGVTFTVNMSAAASNSSTSNILTPSDFKAIGCSIPAYTAGDVLEVEGSPDKSGDAQKVGPKKHLSTEKTPETASGSWQGVLFQVEAGSKAVIVQGITCGSTGENVKVYTTEGPLTKADETNPSAWSEQGLIRVGAASTSCFGEINPVLIPANSRRGFCLFAINDGKIKLDDLEDSDGSHSGGVPRNEDISLIHGHLAEGGSPFTEETGDNWSNRVAAASRIHYTVVPAGGDSLLPVPATAISTAQSTASVASATADFADSFTMMDAGSPFANGKFRRITAECTEFPDFHFGPSEMPGDRVHFHKVDSAGAFVGKSDAVNYAYCYYSGSGDSGKWIVFDATGTLAYKCISDSDFPPTTGWVLYDGDVAEPAPTLIVGSDSVSRNSSSLSVSASGTSGGGGSNYNLSNVMVVSADKSGAPIIDTAKDLSSQFVGTKMFGGHGIGSGNGAGLRCVDMLFAQSDSKQAIVKSITLASLTRNASTFDWGLVFTLDDASIIQGAASFDSMDRSAYERYRDTRKSIGRYRGNPLLPVGQLLPQSGRNALRGFLEAELDFEAKGKLVFVKLFFDATTALRPGGKSDFVVINAVAIQGSLALPDENGVKQRAAECAGDMGDHEGVKILRFRSNDDGCASSGASAKKPVVKVGMRLEAKDRRHPSMICVASISAINGDELTIHFDGWSGYDYTAQLGHEDLHYVGYCAEINHKLEKPGSQSEHSATWTGWDGYLQALGVQAVPKVLFDGTPISEAMAGKGDVSGDVEGKAMLPANLMDFNSVTVDIDGVLQDVPHSELHKVNVAESHSCINLVDADGLLVQSLGSLFALSLANVGVGELSALAVKVRAYVFAAAHKLNEQHVFRRLFAASDEECSATLQQLVVMASTPSGVDQKFQQLKQLETAFAHVNTIQKSVEANDGVGTSKVTVVDSGPAVVLEGDTVELATGTAVGTCGWMNGVFWKVEAKEQVSMTQITAGWHTTGGAPCIATLYTFDGEPTLADGGDTDQNGWTVAATISFMERGAPATLIFDTPLVVKAGSTRGFYLHSSTGELSTSAADTPVQSDGIISLHPSFMSGDSVPFNNTTHGLILPCGSMGYKKSSIAADGQSASVGVVTGPLVGVFVDADVVSEEEGIDSGPTTPLSAHQRPTSFPLVYEWRGVLPLVKDAAGVLSGTHHKITIKKGMGGSSSSSSSSMLSPGDDGDTSATEIFCELVTTSASSAAVLEVRNTPELASDCVAKSSLSTADMPAALRVKLAAGCYSLSAQTASVPVVRLFKWTNEKWICSGTGTISIGWDTVMESCRLFVRDSKTGAILCNQPVLVANEMKVSPQSDRTLVWSSIDAQSEDPSQKCTFSARFKNKGAMEQFKGAYTNWQAALSASDSAKLETVLAGEGTSTRMKDVLKTWLERCLFPCINYDRSGALTMAQWTEHQKIVGSQKVGGGIKEERDPDVTFPMNQAAFSEYHFTKLVQAAESEAAYIAAELDPLGVTSELDLCNSEVCTFRIFASNAHAVDVEVVRDSQLLLPPPTSVAEASQQQQLLAQPALLTVEQAWYGEDSAKPWLGADVTELVRNMVSSGDSLAIPMFAAGNGKEAALSALFGNFTNRCADRTEGSVSKYLNYQLSSYTLSRITVVPEGSHGKSELVVKEVLDATALVRAGDRIIFVGGNSSVGLDWTSAVATADSAAGLAVCVERVQEGAKGIALAVPAAGANKDRLKAGDVVVLTDDFENHSDASGGPLKPGETGIVLEDDDSTKPLKVKGQGANTDTWWYAEKALRLSKPTVKEPNCARELVLTCTLCGMEKQFTFRDGTPVQIEAVSAMFIKIEDDEPIDPALASSSKKTDLAPLELSRRLTSFALADFDERLHEVLTTLQTVYARKMFVPWLEATSLKKLTSAHITPLLEIFRLASQKRIPGLSCNDLTSVLKHTVATSPDVLKQITQLSISEIASIYNSPRKEKPTKWLESCHNYKDNARESGEVVIPGASSIRITFDKKCRTESGCDYLELRGADGRSGPARRLSGQSFNDFTLLGNTLKWSFRSDGSTNYWGYKLSIVELASDLPDEPEALLLKKPCKELARQLVEMVRDFPPANTELANMLVNALAAYATHPQMDKELRIWAIAEISKLLGKRFATKPDVKALTSYLTMKPAKVTGDAAITTVGVEDPGDAAAVLNGAVLVVSGAAHTQSNGYYIAQGEYNGHAEYYAIDNHGRVLEGDGKSSNIFWREGGDGWGIHGVGANATHVAYNVPSLTEPDVGMLPPTEGWQASAAVNSGGGGDGDAASAVVVKCINLDGPVGPRRPPWDFTRWTSASRRSGEIINDGKTMGGQGDWYWCSGTPVPEIGGQYFYECKLVVRDTTDLFFGFGVPDIAGSTIGDDSNISGAYYYKTHKNPPVLYPSEQSTLLGKSCTGDVIRCVLDTVEWTVQFFKNGESVGTEKIKPEHHGKRFAPYATVYYRGATITLEDAGSVGASFGPFGAPRVPTQLPVNVKDEDDSSSDGGTAPAPSSLNELVRRLPVLLDSQRQHERSNSTGIQSPYLGALCDLSLQLSLQDIPFAAQSIDWLRDYKEVVDVARALWTRTPSLPATFIAKVKELKLFKHWAGRIPESWGPVDQVFDQAAFDLSSSLALDQQLIQWHNDPIPLPEVETWKGFPAAGVWTHGALPGKQFGKVNSATSAKWSCHFNARIWKHIECGGGCTSSELSGPKCKVYFKETSGSTAVCAACMFHYGSVTGGTAEEAAGMREALTGVNDMRYKLLEEVPVAALECRAIMLAYFVEEGLIAPSLLPAIQAKENKVLSLVSGLIHSASKTAMIRKAISATMNSSDSNRPQLKLNRLGLVPSPTTGLIGLHGAKSVFGQVMEQLERSEKTVENLWKRSRRLFKVQQLAGEGLDDAGGGYSEIMSHMMKELLVDSTGKSALPLLIRTPNGRSAHGVERDTFIFNPEATLPIHKRMLRFLGLWMGVAVRTDSPIEVPLAGPMWGLLLGRSLVEGVEEDDAPPETLLSTPEARAAHLSRICGSAAVGLKEIDEFAYQEVKRIAELPEEWLGVEDMATTAEFTDACGKLFAVLPNESEVTAANRLAFVTRCLNVRGHEFDQQVAAVRAGMAEVLPMPLMSLVSPTELNDMVCGNPDFDVARLKDAVRLESYSQSSDQIKWLWEVLEGFTAAEKSMFLRFCGGFTRLPHDLKRLPHRFEVHKMRYNNGCLPESATCFFTLKLPQYRTAIELRDKLKVAIYNCGAIDTDGRGGEFEQMPAGGEMDHAATAAAASRLSSVESLY